MPCVQSCARFKQIFDRCRFHHSIKNNTRNKNWGSGMIKAISQRLRNELPGLRGFGESNLKNMRAFYEAWNCIETHSSVPTGELKQNLSTDDVDIAQAADSKRNTIRQLELTNLGNFPIVPFFSISFTHHHSYPCERMGRAVILYSICS